MQLLKKLFFGFIWSIGLLSLSIFILTKILTYDNFKENYNTADVRGDLQLYEYIKPFSGFIILVPLAIGFGGSFMGILPGTRKKTKST